MKRLIYASDHSTEMTIGEFIAEVKRIYNSYFPASECVADNLKTLGMEYIRIKWYLSSDASETSYGIRDNDMFYIAFTIDLEDNTESGKVYEMWTYDNSGKNVGQLPSTITLTVDRKSYFIKDANGRNVYSHRNLPFRKTTGTPEKILSVLEGYVKKLHDSLESDLNAGLVPDQYVTLVESKL